MTSWRVASGGKLNAMLPVCNFLQSGFVEPNQRSFIKMRELWLLCSCILPVEPKVVVCQLVSTCCVNVGHQENNYMDTGKEYCMWFVAQQFQSVRLAMITGTERSPKSVDHCSYVRYLYHEWNNRTGIFSPEGTEILSELWSSGDSLSDLISLANKNQP